MRVNAELKKDVQRNFEITNNGKQRRQRTIIKNLSGEISTDDILKVLKGEEDIPRRVIRYIAKVSNCPVSKYLADNSYE